MRRIASKKAPRPKAGADAPAEAAGIEEGEVSTNSYREQIERARDALARSVSGLICTGDPTEKLPELRAAALALDCCKTLISIAKAYDDLAAEVGGREVKIIFGDNAEQFFE